MTVVEKTRRHAFTLVELLVVISIITILAAILMPAIVATKKAVDNSVASRTGKQLFTSTSIYSSDSDDMYPLAMYQADDGMLVAWFGRQTAKTEFDRQQGILSVYTGGYLQADPTHHAFPYMGDMTGFGYNYGYMGSDFSLTGDYSHWPNCSGPGNSSALSLPSETIVFASSAYYKAPWIPEGDGLKYDFGFIDPPKGWNGNPNVDFRHFDTRKIDIVNKQVITSGRAVIVFADGHVESLKQSQVKDSMFQRDSDLMQ